MTELPLRSPSSARLAAYAAIASLTSFALMHLFMSDVVSPLSDTVSAYALNSPGDFLFVVGAGGFAFACAALAWRGPAVTRRPVVRWLLATAAVMSAITVLFPTDPRDAVFSFSAVVHRYAAGAALVLLISVAAITWRHSQPGRFRRLAATLTVLSSTAMVVTTVNTFFPALAAGGDWRGLPQRVLLLSHGILLIGLGLSKPRRPAPFSVSYFAALYESYAADLRQVRGTQRAHLAAHPEMNVQLDDVEAELTYLLLRAHRPREVVELGCLHGWSTSWILHALRDNGTGVLTSVEIRDDATRRVPSELSDGRWRFLPGDARELAHQLPQHIDYLFIDAQHTAGFARWFIRVLIPRVVAAAPVSVHDVFHGAAPMPISEGSVVLNWLRGNGVGYFTASPAHARGDFETLQRIRAEHGLTEAIHSGRDNPMMYFRQPSKHLEASSTTSRYVHRSSSDTDV